jgi:glutamate N-acetyltransferase/amino-acid N-acetyltransferase
MTAVLTDIDGVYAGGIHIGIKGKKKDLGFLYVPNAVASAGCFTQNKFSASCIGYTQSNLKNTVLKALIVNSGNANAGTGDAGAEDTVAMAVAAADSLGLTPQEVAVASTGVIGVKMPMDKILPGITTLLSDPFVKDTDGLSRAILTTDLCEKMVSLRRVIGGKEVVVAGVAKGSGMIAPNMGTMLAYLVTTAGVSQEVLQACLSEAVEASFNMISVDGDTSTNDMVLTFATGAEVISERADVEAFTALLTEACIVLAKMIAKDGEGATTLIEVRVKHASSLEDAKVVAMSIVNSPLVKTAVHGADPNWGRVMAAAGKNPSVAFESAKMDLFFNEFPVLKQGELVMTDRALLVTELKKEVVVITLDMNLGDANATAWGCDLTKGYIDINTTYC